MSARDDAHEAGHEHTPGMDTLTIGYLVLFFALYLMYFGMVYGRWQVQ